VPDTLFTTDAMRAVFSDRAGLQRMLDFEAALARAEAATGVIPAAAANVIGSHCLAGGFDLQALRDAARNAGNLAIPMVAALTRAVAADGGDARGFVHWGATSQDAIDTGLVLQLRDALDLIEADLARLADALREQVLRHRATVLAGRTWLQQALPVTLGLKFAGTLDAVERHRERMTALRPRLLVLQFGGAAGTLASLGSRGPAVADALAADLNLGVASVPWHTQRDRVCEAATTHGLVVATLGKLARDLSLLAQTEVGEAFEAAAPGRGGSSTLPHKRNPVGAAIALAAAVRVPGPVATMLSAAVQEHERGLGNWPAEWESLPEIVLLTAGALDAMANAVAGLEVDEPRMRANLDLLRGQLLAEAVQMALAPSLGRDVAQRVRGEEAPARCARRRAAGARGTRRRGARQAVRSGRLSGSDRPVHRARPRPPLVSQGACMPFAAISDARIHYRIDGAPDAPVLVLSNSLGTDLEMWESQLSALARERRVLRYDARGHGQSGVTPGPYTIERLGRDVVALLDHLQLDRVDFCGLSMGGMIGMWLGIHASSRLRKLVLANTAARIAPPDLWNARIDKVNAGGMAAISDGVLARWFTPAFIAREPGTLAAMKAMMERMPAAGYVACCAAVRDMDQRAAVAGIITSTLVIVGEHDAATPPADGRFLAMQIPGARVVELPAAHLSNVEEASAFTAALSSFLNA